MLLRLALRLVVLAVIIGVVAEIVPGIDVNGGFLTLLWIAVLFSVVNLILGPLFRLISLPLIVMTLGIFLLVVNAGLLAHHRVAVPRPRRSRPSGTRCSAAS